MENREERRINPIIISSSIPEEHLILMFPFTYAEFRIQMSNDVSFNYYSYDKNCIVNKETSQSFKSFLSLMGPLPEDIQKEH